VGVLRVTTEGICHSVGVELLTNQLKPPASKESGIAMVRRTHRWRSEAREGGSRSVGFHHVLQRKRISEVDATAACTSATARVACSPFACTHTRHAAWKPPASWCVRRMQAGRRKAALTRSAPAAPRKTAPPRWFSATGCRPCPGATPACPGRRSSRPPPATPRCARSSPAGLAVWRS
jgi:hypothetical protein